MMFRMITWDQPKLDKLRAAAEEAVKFRKQTFHVDLDRKHKDVGFNTGEAFDLINQLEAEFERNPQRTFPENREGSEP